MAAKDKRDDTDGPDFPVVGIGASAGGLKAAEVLLKHTPADSGMAFVLVFHLDPKHKSEAATLLQRHTSMPVAQVEDHTLIEPDHVYVIPPNHGLSLVDGHLALTSRKRTDGRPTVIDHFFRSLAEHAGERAIGIVLSGTGGEGSQGLKAIKEAGGLAVVQDEHEAEYSGMPHSAIATGLIDFVLPVAEIPAKLIEIRDSPVDFALRDNERAAGESDAEILQKIFVQLRARVGHDFSQYKQNTVLRRIARRMQVHQLPELDAYLDLLREKPAEVEALFRELLISVTNFFRDPEAMGALEHDVIPKMCKRMEGHSVRVWVPGCATGEEAYSLAIMLGEACDGLATPPRLQIFATDVDERALAIARRGFFPDAIAGDVSDIRLKRFFDRDGDGFTVKPHLREMILFTRHDLLQDPPFSKLDLISCRNLLIYLKTDIQAKIFALFHFALKPQSFLFLGGSETVGSSGKLFGEIDRKAKIFQSRRVPVTEVPFPLLSGTTRIGAKPPGREEPRKRFEDVVRNELLVEYAPPCVIVNENYDVSYISGRVGKYLEPGAGEANYNILDMAREGLRLELRTTLFKAFHDGVGVRGKPVMVPTDRGEEQIWLTVRPVPEAEGHMLVVFEETGSDEPASSSPPPPRAAGDESVIAQLETELTSTRESLQTSIEELETSNEELRASNEELQSMNEELQSTTEELETGKEELQSANEELLALNHELQSRNDELAHTNADLNNLITSTEIATVFLDMDLRVRRYVPRATDIFNLITGDIGRPFAHITHKLGDANLVADAERVLRDLGLVEHELASDDGRFYQSRMRPYRTLDNKVDGVVLTLIDVSERHRREAMTRELNAALAMQKAFGDSIVATVREPLLVLDGALRVVTANSAFYRAFKTTPAPTEHRLLYELGNGEWNIPNLRNLLEEILPRQITVEDFEVRQDFGDGERVLLLNARRMEPHAGLEPLILLAFDDITDRTRDKDVLVASELKYRMLFNSLDEGFCIFEMLYDDAGKPVDYRFLDVNPAFTRHTGLPANAKGRTIREMVPAHEQHWFEIYGKVAATGEPVRFQERGEGMQRWFEVYAFRDGEPERNRVAAIFTDITERRREERELVRMASIVNSSDDAIISKDLHGVINSWNKAAERMFGYTAKEAIGRPITEVIIPPDRMDEENEILRKIAHGESIDHFETVRHCKDGKPVEVSVTISPLRNSQGKIIGASKVARDIGERKHYEEHRELLIQELNHRVKNTLATVQALAVQTFRGTGAKDQLETFDARLLALSAAHDVLTRESWKGAGIRQIVNHAIATWNSGGAERITTHGPILRLRPSAALAISMALHELATNAVKYGALSAKRGKVSIRWTISADAPARFRMQWQESGGPPVRRPSRRGFGSRLIETGLAQDLGGNVKLSFDEAGVTCMIEAPVEEIRETDVAP